MAEEPCASMGLQAQTANDLVASPNVQATGLNELPFDSRMLRQWVPWER